MAYRTAQSCFVWRAAAAEQRNKDTRDEHLLPFDVKLSFSRRVWSGVGMLRAASDCMARECFISAALPPD